jgi:hypothetical protein
LQRLPEDPLASFRVLVPRARVRRIMGFAAVFAGDRRRSAELIPMRRPTSPGLVGTRSGR